MPQNEPQGKETAFDQLYCYLNFWSHDFWYFVKFSSGFRIPIFGSSVLMQPSMVIDREG